MVATHSATHVVKYLRTLVIKMYLRALLIYYAYIGFISVNGNYINSAVHVEWCLRTLVIKMFRRISLHT